MKLLFLTLDNSQLKTVILEKTETNEVSFMIALDSYPDLYSSTRSMKDGSKQIMAVKPSREERDWNSEVLRRMEIVS